MSFKNDLANAQQVEQELQQMYIQSGYTATTTASLGMFKGYDIHIQSGDTISYTQEVKHDIMSDVTGNVAIEIYKMIDNVKYQSGLTATKADYQVYKLKDKFYSIATDDLKKLLKELKANGAVKFVWGGDNNSVWICLVDKYTFKRNSKQI